MTGRHREFLPISLGACALVTIFGVINDQAIAAISPAHFLFYYPNYFPFTQPWAQALCLSLVVTGGSSLAWGILLYWAGHYGPGPVVGTRATLIGAAVVVVVTVAVAWSLGWRVSATGNPLYPMYFYPSADPKLYISQTVQLTNYLVGITGAASWLLAIKWWRWLKEPAEEKAS